MDWYTEPIARIFVVPAAENSQQGILTIFCILLSCKINLSLLIQGWNL
jgi:hypothetical protein